MNYYNNEDIAAYSLYICIFFYVKGVVKGVVKG